MSPRMTTQHCVGWIWGPSWWPLCKGSPSTPCCSAESSRPPPSTTQTTAASGRPRAALSPTWSTSTWKPSKRGTRGPSDPFARTARRRGKSSTSRWEKLPSKLSAGCGRKRGLWWRGLCSWPSPPMASGWRKAARPWSSRICRSSSWWTWSVCPSPAWNQLSQGLWKTQCWYSSGTKITGSSICSGSPWGWVIASSPLILTATTPSNWLRSGGRRLCSGTATGHGLTTGSGRSGATPGSWAPGRSDGTRCPTSWSALLTPGPESCMGRLGLAWPVLHAKNIESPSGLNLLHGQHRMEPGPQRLLPALEANTTAWCWSPTSGLTIVCVSCTHRDGLPLRRSPKDNNLTC